jgi:hypothetical protein
MKKGYTKKNKSPIPARIIYFPVQNASFNFNFEIYL